MNTPEKLPIINCVVVTYNRLSLLQENILALKQQTHSLFTKSLLSITALQMVLMNF